MDGEGSKKLLLHKTALQYSHCYVATPGEYGYNKIVTARRYIPIRKGEPHDSESTVVTRS